MCALHSDIIITRLHPQGRVARRAYVLDRKYRFSIRELPDFGSQNQKNPKNTTFLEHFLITKYRFSIREAAKFWIQNWFQVLVKNHICEGILTKTGEMSFYLKQLWDTYMYTEHRTNILRT